MNAYVAVGTLAELPAPGGVLRVDVRGDPVAIVCTGDSDSHDSRDSHHFYAISDVCSHAEVALSDGDFDGTTVECWLHGSRFDVRTGRPLGPPATRPVPVYDLKFEGDHVYVSTASIPTQESSR
jgi:3-phenylpropionate/trans-cinnamate dioxygenase ferredoxin subunit